MANGVNKVILIGNLGRDPEIMNFENGVKKATFSLATTEISRDKEGKRIEHTEWHNIVLWRGLAEVAENYLKKGNQVYIEGRLRTRSWDDKEGNKRYTTEILADNMTMLGGPRPVSEQENGGSRSEAYAEGNPSAEVVSENGNDDLPF